MNSSIHPRTSQVNSASTPIRPASRLMISKSSPVAPAARGYRKAIIFGCSTVVSHPPPTLPNSHVASLMFTNPPPLPRPPLHIGTALPATGTGTRDPSPTMHEHSQNPCPPTTRHLRRYSEPYVNQIHTRFNSLPNSNLPFRGSSPPGMDDTWNHVRHDFSSADRACTNQQRPWA